MTTVLRPRLAGLVAAALAAAAGLVGLSSAPAAAAVCSGKGVNVVVDSNDGARRWRAEGRATSGVRIQDGSDKVFPAAGFALTMRRNPDGFVCQVNGKPAKANPCSTTSPANAVLGSVLVERQVRTWNYSSSRVSTALTVSPTAGSMAFSWQEPAGRRPARCDPAQRPSRPRRRRRRRQRPSPRRRTRAADKGVAREVAPRRPRRRRQPSRPRRLRRQPRRRPPRPSRNLPRAVPRSLAMRKRARRRRPARPPRPQLPRRLRTTPRLR